jgi:ribosomal protein L40E
MARKTLGYVKLEWTCPNCGSKNPGPQKTCLTCGGPQPVETAFNAGAGQPLIQGEEAEKIAAQGADIHCPFCGARNPANAAVCSQCGGDLKGGVARPAGQVLGAFTPEPAPEVTCPNCGQPNPAAATHCRNCGASLAKPAEAAPSVAPGAPRKLSLWMIVVGAVVLVGLIIGCLALSGLFTKSEQVVGTVQDVAWQTSVLIEAYQPVERGGWKDEIPAGVELVDCEYRYAYTSDQPQPVATEVCGTPYTVDQGSGYGEVVQDCTYKVYAEYCSYTVAVWVVVDRAVIQGSDLAPRLAQPALASGQRLGQTSQEYSITFVTDQGVMTYTTTDLDLFSKAVIGSRWNLTISGAGRIVSAEPVN